MPWKSKRNTGRPSPVKKRDDYPEMPPQAHLPNELRLEVAREMLQDGR